MRTELESRLVPIMHNEVSYALNRPQHERTRVPKPGDRVYYRRHEWDQAPTLATVLAVADLDDRSDPNLWHPVRDNRTGQPLVYQGQPCMVRAPDPLPWVDLQPDDALDNLRTAKPARCEHCDHVHTQPVARTWEARVRGMPGWLPLTWRDRHVRLPHELLAQPVAPAIDRWRFEQGLIRA